jgi:endonuclease/exonuclease/phosphatase family metal-dependent hydrolase
VWDSHSGTTGQVLVTGSRVFISDSNSEDVNALLNQTIGPSSGAVLYARFTLTCSKLPSSTGNYFAHFYLNGSSFCAKIFAQTSGAVAGKYRIGIANTASLANAVVAFDLATNTPYTVVLRHVVSNAVSTLWINPSSEYDAGVTDTNLTTGIAVAAFALRETDGIGAHYIDDLMVSTNASEIFPGPRAPTITTQPVSVTVTEGANATFGAVASGTSPFTYQWVFNGTLIPDATNASLLLTNVSVSQSGAYRLTVSNPIGTTNSDAAVLTVNPVVLRTAASGFTLVHYNVKGNFASDWSTNAPQVQAIARQLRYLNPDIITINEIPHGDRYEMTNWMTAFFPGYNLAVSPGTDGFIQSGVITRFSITASNSWLDGASLTNFGYNGTFTRDLYEVQIAVPGFTAPLHVFTTHLKSGQTTDDSARRAAETKAITNFLVTLFLPAYPAHPYLLTGDLNEDIARPASGSQQPIQRLTSTPTGLRLITPLNPYSGSELTHSIQDTNGLDKRYDYIMPCGLLCSNIVFSQVFRTDLLPSPPLPLLSGDDAMASDHLPVLMAFNNPYDQPFRLTSLIVTNGAVTVKWEGVAGRSYWVESSTNLTVWTTVASNLVAEGTNTVFTTSAAGCRFLRIGRKP